MGDRPLEGRLLGEFRVDEKLGDGGFGTVYRATQQRLGREAVVKVLRTRSGRVGDPRLLREGLLAARLDHPFAAHVYDSGIEEDGLAWIAMERVRGEGLDGILERQGPMPLDRFVPLLERICEVVQSAHEQGIVHRDIKPANVMVLDRAGKLLPKLLDFGIAKAQGELAEFGLMPDGPPAPDGGDGGMWSSTLSVHMTALGAAVGSPAYMAPEQWRDASSVDFRCDLYSLGVLAYEALTGRKPFAGKTIEELARAHAEEPAPPVGPGLPPALDGFFARALAKDSASRFASATELARALRAVADLTSRVAPARHARWPWRVAPALLAVVAAGGGSYYYWRGTLPTGERQLALTVRNLGGDDDGWLAPIFSHLATRALAERERRFWLVRSGEGANVVAEVGYRRLADRMALEVRVGRKSGRLELLPGIDGASAAQAVDRLVDELDATVGAGREPRPLSPAEAAEVTRVGAPSFEALRSFHRLEARFFAYSSVDLPPIEHELVELIRADPGWAHPYVLLAIVQGRDTPAARATIADGLAKADPARDEPGRAMLAVLAPLRPQDLAERLPAFEAARLGHPDEMTSGMVLAYAYFNAGRPSDREAIFRALHEAHPELQFGEFVTADLRGLGRGEEADRFDDDWLARAPESETAQAARMSREVREGHVERAEARARRLLFVHGETPNRYLLLCDALLLAGRYDEARAVAEKILQGGPAAKAHGYRRIAYIDIFEGQLSAAYSALDEAVPYAHATGREGAEWDVLENLARLATYAAPRDLKARLEDIAAFEERRGQPWFATVDRLEWSLLHTEPRNCPDLSSLFKDVPGHRREQAELMALRLAAKAGCATCADVVRAGALSAFEYTGYPVRLFAECAEREGDFARARAALMRLLTLSDLSINQASYGATPVDYVLAHFQLGRVLAELGDRAGARAEYEVFLRHWGNADRKIPEVDEARRALADLQ
jgi:tetratricopeptide (TPR) repeat protein